jgi:cytochrome c-type biogenesis protein CcmE
MSSSQRRGSTPRLIVALTVASILAVFLLYTSLGGSATPSLNPRSVVGHSGEVMIAGAVTGPLSGDAHGSGLRFTLREIGGTATVPVVYRGSVPDLFKLGRHVLLRGQMREGIFEAVPGSLMTKCPSKYSGKA